MVRHHNCEDHVRNRTCVACCDDRCGHGPACWYRKPDTTALDENHDGERVVCYDNVQYDEYCISTHAWWNDYEGYIDSDEEMWWY